MSIKELADFTSSLLLQRSFNKRKITKSSLSHTSFLLPEILQESKYDPLITLVIYENIQLILNDCEPYFGMQNEKITDALAELSNLACIFVADKDSKIYNKILEIIGRVRSMYPTTF